MPEIIYNVTVNVDRDIHTQWLQWMETKHLPEMMALGLFMDYTMLRLISQLGEEDEQSITYAVQYRLPGVEQFLQYTEQHAPTMQAKGRELFGDKVLAFRTLLEIMHTNRK